MSSLTESQDVQRFLEWDNQCAMADNYLIAVALIYMLRAKYSIEQYSYFNLMVALYLAHEVEEENFEYRNDFVWAAFGTNSLNTENVRLFAKRREKLWRDMGYNVIVKREEAESMMNKIMRHSYAAIGRVRSPETMYWQPAGNRKRSCSLATSGSVSTSDGQPIPILGRGASDPMIAGSQQFAEPSLSDYFPLTDMSLATCF